MIFIILFAITVLLVINIFYRILINQDEVLGIKDRMKELEGESKKYKDDKDKTKEYFSKMMDENRKLTKLSLKPMIVSFLIVMIMLPIMSFFYADYAIGLNDSSGNVTINTFYTANLQNNTVQFLAEGNEVFSCEMPCYKYIDDKYFKLEKERAEQKERIKISRIVAESPVAIPFIGKDLGWIWIYILLSIPLTIVTKKLMGVKI